MHFLSEYVNTKKGNLPQAIDDQASINTPEATSGTVPSANLTQATPEVKQKWELPESK